VEENGQKEETQEPSGPPPSLARRISRYLRRSYRDVAALVFFLFVYPQLINEAHFSMESESWVLLCGFWFALALLGAGANVAKLGTLDSKINELKLHKEVKVQAIRFLAGWIALPLMILLPVFIWLDPDDHEALLGCSFMVLGLVLWLLVLNFGTGSKRPPTSKQTATVATVVLIFFELFLYTMFLESMWMTERSATMTIGLMFKLAIPMSVLYFLLFLPATIGFYIEAIVRHRSHALGIFVMWGRFVFYRYLPCYFVFYLEDRGINLPWII
jgi:hypothetical protein